MNKKIEALLHQALVEKGKMEYSLYEYELKEHIDYWYESLKADKDDFIFAVTENSGDIAMVLITTEKIVYINEEAREKLSQIWLKAYTKNMNRLIPMMAAQLVDGIIAVNGVQTMANKPPRRQWVKKNS